MPSGIEEILNLDIDIERISERFVEKNNASFFGRGTHYPIALEGAAKLKEISYIHAEAYPAGELKHGPLALVDDSMPVVAVAPSNELIGKLKSNLEEVRARGAQLLIFADEEYFFKRRIRSDCSKDTRVLEKYFSYLIYDSCPAARLSRCRF